MRTIENKTNSQITVIFKITGAKCIGKKVTIKPKEFVVINHEVDIIEIVEH